MDGSQIIFDLGWLIGAVFVPIGLWLAKRLKDAEKSLSQVDKSLSNYKLEAERQFASVSHLHDVEARLVDEIKGLRHDIKDLTNAMHLLAAGARQYTRLGEGQ